MQRLLPSTLFAIVLAAGFFCRTVDLHAQGEAAGYAETYTLRNLGARSIGMAGAYSAVANEPMTLFYNSAGLAFLSPRPLVSTAYSFLEFGRQHATLTYGQRVTEDIGVGAGINSYAAGSFVARNVQGQALGTYSNQQLSLAAGAAYKISENSSAGVTAKYFLNSLQGSGDQAQGFAVDIGTKMNLLDLFSLGVSIQNLGGSMKWENDSYSEKIPYTIRFGLATEFGLNQEEYVARTNVRGETDTVFVPATHYVLVSLETVLHQFSKSPTLYLGTEVLPIDILAIRAGIALVGEDVDKTEFFPGSQFGAGISLRLPALDLPFQVQLDYAISNDRVASSNIGHYLSLLAEF